MSGDYSWLPTIYREIADVAGLDAALRLGERYGGGWLRLPCSDRLSEDHALVALIGWSAAEAVCNWRGGDAMILPLPPESGLSGKRRRALRALAEGKGVDEAARIAGMTSRSMHRYRAKARSADKRQRSFFDPD